MNLLLLITISIYSVVTQRCQRTIIRKEIRQLTPDEKDQFFNALVQVNRIGPNGEMSIYDQLVQKHLTVIKYAHGYAPFLVWHRYFIKEFERALQIFAPNIGLPYWDWSLDSQSPERSEILTDAYFGDANGKCIQSGYLRNWSVSFPNRHCLKRKYNGGDSIGSFYSPESCAELINNSNTYDDFRKNLENQIHGLVHEGLGADMSIMISPNDPVFYIHHSYVDKLWVRWQAKDTKNIYDYSGALPDTTISATPDDFLQDTNIRIRELLDIRNLCYSYSQSGSDFIDGSGTAPQATAARSLENMPRRNGGRRSADSRRGGMNNRQMLRKRGYHHKADYEQGYGQNENDQYVNESYEKEDDSFDRESNLNYLRKPAGYSEEWIKMNNLDSNEVNSQHQSAIDKIDELNRSGYKSPISLNNVLKFDTLIHDLAGASNINLFESLNLDSTLGSILGTNGVPGIGSGVTRLTDGLDLGLNSDSSSMEENSGTFTSPLTSILHSDKEEGNDGVFSLI